MKSDVLLLADVLENFRIMCKAYYGLDCDHSLAWDSFLKMTNIKLELISDVHQHLFNEEGLRGGISSVTHRKVKEIINIWQIMMKIKNQNILYM